VAHLTAPRYYDSDYDATAAVDEALGGTGRIRRTTYAGTSPGYRTTDTVPDPPARTFADERRRLEAQLQLIPGCEGSHRHDRRCDRAAQHLVLMCTVDHQQHESEHRRWYACSECFQAWRQDGDIQYQLLRKQLKVIEYFVLGATAPPVINISPVMPPPPAPTIVAPTPKEIVMSETKIEKPASSFAETNAIAFRAAKRGAKVAASTKASKVCVAAVRKMLGANYPTFFQAGLGKQIEPFAAAYLVCLLAASFSDKIPNAEQVKAVAEYAMEGTSRDALEPLIGGLSQVAGSFVGVTLPGA
jgi:hypothetical protein